MDNIEMAKLEIKTTIPSRNFKRNPEWLFANISIIGDVKTNLYKANNFAKIVIDKKNGLFKYNKLEYPEIGRLIRTILSV